MNANDWVRLILALCIPIFIIGVFALRFAGYSPDYADGGSLAMIEAWENILIFIVGGLIGYGTKGGD
jgi:hypothetical protein